MPLKRRYLFGLLVMAATALLPTQVSAAGPAPFATGFDSPRGIAYVNGKLLVAEAGHGGDVCNPGPPKQCLGTSGQISVLDPRTGAHHALVSNLFSTQEFLAPPPNPPDTLGIGGLSAGGGRTLGIMNVYPQQYDSWTCAGQPADCADVLAAASKQAGQLISISSGGKWHAIASVGATDFDRTAGVPGQEHDANPYGVLAISGGAYVADAGSNTLELVRGRSIADIFRFPNVVPQPIFPRDAVPTCVARTDDALWVADLSGRLWRVHGKSATQVAQPPAQHITGCTAGEDGNLYLVNMWTGSPFPAPGTGNITRYNPETGTTTVVAGGLNFPNMIAIGGGALWVTANSVCRAIDCGVGGTVLRFPLAGEEENQVQN